MTNLTGTEKQIEWAMRIKTGWLGQLAAIENEARERVNNGNMPAVWLEIVSAQVAKTTAALDAWKSASMFIDKRNLQVRQVVEKDCRAQYSKKQGTL